MTQMMAALMDAGIKAPSKADLDRAGRLRMSGCTCNRCDKSILSPKQGGKAESFGFCSGCWSVMIIDSRLK